MLFKTGKLPKLEEYVGRMVTVAKEPIPKKVKIEKICGNLTKPHFYEINGKYLVNMLRFHAEMEGDKSITEDQFLAFEQMEMEAEPVKKDQPKQQTKDVVSEQIQ